MGRFLYIFPHPDDESFGPAPALARHRRRGHEVFLLTLTKGEATKERLKHGYTKAQMAEVRYAEMQEVARVLDLNGMTVLDFPDGGLPELDPLELEEAVENHIKEVRPDIVVTYAVHGISGHPDHLVGHAVVKHAFCDLRQKGAAYLKRLAFFTLPQDGAPDRPSHLKGSPPEAIDCKLIFSEADLAKAEEALQCYASYKDIVDAQQPLKQVSDGVCYEFFQEHYFPPVNDLFAGMEGME
jgi:N-acetylglucosamine malate deacetylase 2